MKPAPGTARAEGGSKTTVPTDEALAPLRAFVSQAIPSAPPSVRLGYAYIRLGLHFLDTGTARAHEFERLLQQAMHLAEAGQLFVSDDDRDRFVDATGRALRGDAVAYGKLENYFADRPHMRLKVRTKYSREAQANGG